MPIAGGEQRRCLSCGQLVGCQVASVFVNECQRAVVDDEMLGEKALGGTKTARKQTPQPFAADLGAWAIKTFDPTLRMFAARFADGRLDLHPGSDRVDFTKGHTGLHHAE